MNEDIDNSLDEDEQIVMLRRMMIFFRNMSQNFGKAISIGEVWTYRSPEKKRNRGDPSSEKV